MKKEFYLSIILCIFIISLLTGCCDTENVYLTNEVSYSIAHKSGYSYQSMDSSIVTIDSKGTITAHGNGDAIIYVKENNRKKKKYKVTVDVSWPETISFEEDNISIHVDEKYNLNYFILPESNIAFPLTIKPMDSDIVEVTEGTLIGKKEGATSIVVYYENKFLGKLSVSVLKKKAYDMMDSEEKSFYTQFVRNLNMFKDPSSLSITDINESSDGKAWYVTVSGKNGLGGYSSGTYTLTKTGTLSKCYYQYGFSKPSTIDRFLINRALSER